MHTRLLRSRTAGLAGAMVLTLAFAADAEAQKVNAAGNANVTDISGTIITTGDFVGGLFLGEPGPVQSFSCAEATGVRNVALALVDELESDAFRIARRNPGSVIVSRELAESLHTLLTGTNREDAAASRIEKALTPSGNGGRAARRAAQELTSLTDGLIGEMIRMDPHRPGHRGATRLARAVAGFNTFVNASSEEFLRHPPDEFLAVQAVLSRMVIAALDNQGRPETCGVLPPPPPAPSEPPPPPPVLERAVSVCILLDDQLREVPVIVIPATGDSLVVVEGQRRSLSEVHPPAAYAAGAELTSSDAPIELEGRTYLRFGLARAVRPGELKRGGEFQGVGIFVEVGASTPPEAIYVPVGQGCVVQPYERQEVVRRVDG